MSIQKHELLTPADGNRAVATECGRQSRSISGVLRSLVGVALLGPWFALPADAQNTIVSSFPPLYQPGVAFTVTNAATPAGTALIYAVEDQPPVGWAVSSINQGGVFDVANRKVKWGPFLDNLSRQLTYQTTPPSNATSHVTFAGDGSFSWLLGGSLATTNVLITGQRDASPLAVILVSSVVSALPPNFQPGVAFSVTNTSVPATAVNVYAVQDTVPAGWTVTNISDGGVFDAPNHTVKWGPFFDHQARALNYVAVPPADPLGIVTFIGSGFFDSAPVPITGQRSSTALITSSSVVSAFPPQYTPGLAFTLTNAATPRASVSVYAVEDQVPEDWNVGTISDGGVFDTANRKVKWGPFFDDIARLLTCQITPPLTATGTVSFAGSGLFDGEVEAIIGQRTTSSMPSPPSGVTCLMPATYLAGASFTVTNLATPGANVGVYAVEDQPPANWTPSAISDAGVFDALNNKVKWGPFFDNAPRALSYSVTPSTDATGQATFSGTGSFDAVVLPITGQRQMTLFVPDVGSVTSALLTNYAPGVAFMVTDLAAPGSGIVVYAVEDHPPAGWVAGPISDGGVFDALNNKVKWGPFFDGVTRALNYQVTPPGNAFQAGIFSGSASFNAQSVAIGGLRASFRSNPNLAPSLAPIPAQFVNVEEALVLTNIATDPNVPPRHLAFALDAGSPTGMTINPTNGILAWVPSTAEGGGVHSVTVRVVNDGFPPLSDAQSFAVTVGHYAQITIDPAILALGQTGSVVLTLLSSAPVTNLSFVLDLPGGRVTNILVQPLVSGQATLTQQPPGAVHSVISLSSLANQALQGPSPIALLSFTAITNRPSGFFNMRSTAVSAQQDNGALVPKTFEGSGQLTLIGVNSLIEARLTVGGQRELVVYGAPGTYYLESTTNLAPPVIWAAAGQVSLTNLFQVSDEIGAATPVLFFRARQ